MNALWFAWRSLVRQPARATLGIVGVAAVGALLFDMLLLSRGLVVSMGDLLDRIGFDVRVTAAGASPGSGPSIAGAAGVARQIGELPSVASVVTLRFAEAAAERPGDGRPVSLILQGAGGDPKRPWTILRGREPDGTRELVLNENAARELTAGPGSSISIQPSCSSSPEALPSVVFLVAGIADFPFDTFSGNSAASSAEALAALCTERDQDAVADVIMVRSADSPDTAAAAIAAIRPDLDALTNDEALGRMQQGNFSYFRQISTVLTTVTLSFALLLITVLLTVSVNQRLGEIAALRALGFSQRRVVADVFCESALIVGTGGLLSLPLGAVLAAWLDRILKNIPGVPADLHFFVFQERALVIHLALLVVTAVAAALYPMQIVARLPIASTLRDEVGT
jgi:putative ABC transport system permease protein